MLRGAATTFLLAATLEGALVTIDNLSPRFDANGTIMNAHDGTIRWLNGEWWVHAASYGEDGGGDLCDDPPLRGCDSAAAHGCGFHANHNVSMFSSPDLSSGSWVYRGDALRCAEVPDCAILYRPHLVWNPSTRLYVLFYNYVSASGKPQRIGAATSASPGGPFTLRTANISNARPVLPSNHHGSMGDFDVLVDPADGAGYIVYSYGPMSLEKLAPDFLSSAGINASFVGGGFGGTTVPTPFAEAPALWTRSVDGTTHYYLTLGHCCCFCWQGSGMIVYRAQHPLGPWVAQSGGADLGCTPGASNPTPVDARTLPLTAQPSPGQGCNYPSGTVAASVSRAQQNFVFPVRTADGGTAMVYTGDRWMQAPDGKKAHEPQFWTHLEFDSTTHDVLPLRWNDTLAIDLAVPQPQFPPNPASRARVPTLYW